MARSVSGSGVPIDLWGCTGSDPHGIEILCMVGGGRGWVRGEQVPNFETAKKQVPNHEKKNWGFSAAPAFSLKRESFPG